MRLAPVVLLPLLWPSLAFAQTVTATQTITATTAPLSRIFLGVDGSTQIEHLLDASYEVYPPSGVPGDYGTILAIDGALYAPDFDNHSDGTATDSLNNVAPYIVLTPVFQTGVLGTGAAFDPFRVTTSLAAGGTGVQVVQTDAYAVGAESYLTTIQLTNTSTSPRVIVLYRAADCYLGGSDSGYGAVDPLSGAVSCSSNPDNNPPDRIEQWLPISSGASHFQAGYDTVWSWIATRAPFPDSCECTVQQDNGAGLSWSLTLAPGETTSRSHLTTFSPVGNVPVVTLKLADTGTVTSGGRSGYTVFFDNANIFAVTLDQVVDLLPAGFSYVPGTTSGALTSDPVIAGQQLSWAGPLVVAGQSTAMLHFEVIVATATGAYYNNASALTDGLVAVAPTGDTARIDVVLAPPPTDGGVETDGAVGDGGGPSSDGGPIENDGGPIGDGAVDLDGGVDPDGGSPGDAALPPDLGSPDAGGDGGTVDSGPADSGAAPFDAGTAGPGDESSDEGCDCRARRGRPGSIWASVALFGWVLMRRKKD
ncbi:MAG: hypothetical protein IPG45_31205 [Deltaproteobacteria bacterium]|nr:hypothetical protein [Deltaproteobacteria bacterium]